MEQGTEGMLRNPHYVFSLIVALALGFVLVLAMPVGGPQTRDMIAMRTQSTSAGSSVHSKSPTMIARPVRAPARQVAIASPLPQRDDTRFPAVQPAFSRWSYPSLTKLVSMTSSPFPYSGLVPRTKRPFLNFKDRGRQGRKTRSGRVYWADKTYSDSRVLLHIPRGFDTGKPAVIVLFFHGHGATLARDVVARQRLPAQISNSGINAVLVAPQFAVDARDSSAGNFWKPGGTRRFLDEVAPQLARLLGNPQSRYVFARMPVVIVGYSGGYVPTAWSLANGGIGPRVKGVVLLDGLYGELGRFANWIERNTSGFFLSAYATSTMKGNASLKRMLKKRGIAYSTKLRPSLKPGSVTFIKAVKGHRDYVTRAWADNPISDLLARIPDATPRIDPVLSALFMRPRAN
jgi:hypothetical protein